MMATPSSLPQLVLEKMAGIAAHTSTLIAIGGSLILVRFLVLAVYNVFLHPLAKYPGPRLCAISKFPLIYSRYCGTNAAWVKELHNRYGEVVRFAPDQMSFISPQAWKDIYGHRSGGKKPILKDPHFYIREANGEYSIVTTPNLEEHNIVRHVFAHGFSDRAIKEQEPIIQRYADQFIQLIKQKSAQNPEEPFDIVRLFNFTTFDIMADLTFGEPLGLLQQSEYTPWVRQIFDRLKFGIMLHVAAEYPLISLAIKTFYAKTLAAARKRHFQHVVDRVDLRMEKGNNEPDIWNLALTNKNVTLPRAKMYSSASAFMVAGTETTATILSGTTFLLLTHPDKLRKAQDEVRSQISEDALNIENLPRLKYLGVCFEEAFRLYPPVPVGLPRIIPEGGVSIAGHWIPGKTVVSVPQLAAYHYPRFFKDSESFIPERWLPGTGYDDDRRDVVQPFLVGPRVCLGKNLAMHELRVIFAKLLWNFDLEIDARCSNWTKQNTYFIWEKPPLLVKARPVLRHN